MTTQRWLTGANTALFTDFYQLTMLQSYWREHMDKTAVFSLFVRRLPPYRNYLLAAGLEDALLYLESLRFTDDDLSYLDSLNQFAPDFLQWLKDFRFTGDVYAMQEGTPFFANEPILEIAAPLPQAQLVETFLINQIHNQTMLASKASRVVQAAQGRDILDFGTRRMHGTDSSIKGARAFYIAGVGATSNVYAGKVFGIPVLGTMAHSYIQAHLNEMDAFRQFQTTFPTTVLLVDTYSTEAGIRKVIELAQELGDDFKVSGIRLDSGDLSQLARKARAMLDRAGLSHVRIIASSNLDEYALQKMLDAGVPIDGFGVGTNMGVSQDFPSLDMVYKLVEYDGRGTLKRSPGKQTLPGRKQVFREEKNGQAYMDRIAKHTETFPGKALLNQVMSNGKRLPHATASLEELRANSAVEIGKLSPELRGLIRAHYPVETSPQLLQEIDKLSTVQD